MSDKFADESRSVFMFELTKHKLSSFSEASEAWSQTCQINNLIWQLQIKKQVVDRGTKEEFLSVYLYCEPSTKSELWCCSARVKFVLRSNREDRSWDFCREFSRLYSTSAPACGFEEFIEWAIVTHPSHGYISGDVVKIQAYIDAEPPQNIESDYEKEQPQDYEGWQQALFEEDINQKIVGPISEELKKVSETVEKGQENAQTLMDTVETIVSNISPLNEKIDSLCDKLENLCAKQNPVAKNTSKDELNKSMDAVLRLIDKKILSLQKNVEKISGDNVAAIVNEVKFSILKRNNGEIVGNNENKSTDKAVVDGGEPILVSILKILHELRTDVKKELFVHHGDYVANSGTASTCNGYQAFGNRRARLDSKRDHSPCYWRSQSVSSTPNR